MLQVREMMRYEEDLHIHDEVDGNNDSDINDIEELPTSSNVKSNAKAIISSESYVDYLRSQKKKKDDLTQQKKEKKKHRLRKAEEKLLKMSANVSCLRVQVEKDEKE